MNMTTDTELKNLLRLNRTASPDQASDKPAPAASLGAGADGHRDRTRIGRIVLGSMAAGLLAAVVLAAAPFMPATEEGVTGAVLIGFALGWALLAVLSTRFSDQPQQWAAAPAMFMGVSGVLMLRGSTSFVHDALAWVWPPALLVLVIWMFTRARRQLHSRTRRWVLNPVLMVLVLAAVGAGYETARESIDARVYAMPGQLVDVGGHRLHLSCTGEGSPTVVLEPGAGGMSSTMGLIAPAVARDTRVCVYDRAGRGWSDPAEGTQDGTRIATDLHTLLHTAGIPGPYLLAGHSFGGLYVRSYAAQYPDDVAGLVLVDSTEATTTTAAAGSSASSGPGAYDAMGRVSAAVSAAARLGLGRLVAQLSYASLPTESRNAARARTATAEHAGSAVDEYVTANASMEQARSLVDFAGKPLVVLTAGTGSAPGWSTKQDHLATLSTNSVHRVVDGASHDSLVDNAHDAANVSQAISEVITSVRTTTPLTGP
jgi:pimeloyl-ACP methyl ester carboxylesterase/FtsH-binding integral membrane protein